MKVTATAIEQVQSRTAESPANSAASRKSRRAAVGANMSLAFGPEHLLPSDIADVTPEGEVRVSSS
ncbi:hypothetical protein KCP75_22400 [Salmonella enterica subsp. enterica]|nr:hypothetical protein KCP75_22400 [Salmonella enterica subsp. enterica]